MLTKVKIITLLLIVLLSGVDNLLARTVTINLTAEVIYVDDHANVLNGQIAEGSLITGSYTYDTNTPDTNPFPTVGDYDHHNPPCGIFLTGSGLIFRSDPEDLEFLVELCNNHSGRDNYLLRSYRNKPLSNGFPVEHISWQLDDYSGTALDSIALPVTPPVLEDWPDTWCHLDIDLGYKYGCHIRAEVTSVQLAYLSLISPNGEEIWIAGTPQTIQWISDPCTPMETVKLEYSGDDSNNWHQIGIVPNTGSYNWIVPNLTSSQCRIKISDVQSEISDISDLAFTIKCSEAIPGDINGDCYVDLKDLAILTSNWLSCNDLADPTCAAW